LILLHLFMTVVCTVCKINIVFTLFTYIHEGPKSTSYLFPSQLRKSYIYSIFTKWWMKPPVSRCLLHAKVACSHQPTCSDVAMRSGPLCSMLKKGPLPSDNGSSMAMRVGHNLAPPLCWRPVRPHTPSYGSVNMNMSLKP
jgi:hypothetical protein